MTSVVRPRTARNAPRKAAKSAARQLAAMRRPSGEFDASRYFRGGAELRFYNVGTDTMRALARSIYQTHRADWSLDEAVTFADWLIRDPVLEVKSLGLEVLARYRREFTPRLLDVCRRWLASNYSANWATTDLMCGAIVGPLLVRYPGQSRRMRAWARDRNLWVRRASIVGLIPSVRRGASLDLAYEIAARLHGDREDLVQKAVGWALREAGKADMARLQRYLRANGPSIPRTTVRYAIERFAPAVRAALLKETRDGR